MPEPQPAPVYTSQPAAAYTAQPAAAAYAAQPNAAAYMSQPQQSLDMAAILAMVRAAVDHEVAERMSSIPAPEAQSAAVSAAAPAQTVPAAPESAPEEPAAPEEEFVFEIEPAPAPEPQAEGVFDYEEVPETPVPESEEYAPQEAAEETSAEPPEDDFDFDNSFDIMALLDAQLDSYSEMNLLERMEEIDAMTMDITLEDLAAYIKDLRKRRSV